jgi:hypothetical protein
VTPARDPKTTENERRGPRRGHANEVPARTDVSAIIKDGCGVAVEAEAWNCCAACGHDPVTALRQVLAERHEAWRAGILEGYGRGWDQRGEYEAERGRAA